MRELCNNHCHSGYVLTIDLLCFIGDSLTSKKKRWNIWRFWGWNWNIKQFYLQQVKLSVSLMSLSVSLPKQTWTPCPPSSSLLIYLRTWSVTLNTKHAVRKLNYLYQAETIWIFFFLCYIANIIYEHCCGPRQNPWRKLNHATSIFIPHSNCLCSMEVTVVEANVIAEAIVMHHIFLAN